MVESYLREGRRRMVAALPPWEAADVADWPVTGQRAGLWRWLGNLGREEKGKSETR